MKNNIKNFIKNRTKVISLQYGLGEIIGNYAMYDGIDDFLGVEYSEDDKIRYFCIKHISDVRILSSKSNIEDALKVMSLKLEDSSLKNNFNESSIEFLQKDVIFIIERIVDLFRKIKLTEEENILLNITIESLISEVEEVYKVDQQCARGIVSDFMKSA